VAVPPAVVIVGPAVKLEVPDGANQTLSVAAPPELAELTIVTGVPWVTLALDANTVS
jgi:hypothetical protein